MIVIRKKNVSKIVVVLGLVDEVRNQLNHTTFGEWTDRGTPIA